MQVALLGSGLLMAHALSVQDRGNSALLLVTPGVASQLVAAGIPASATIHIAREARAATPLLRMLRPTILIQSVSCLALTLAIDAVLFRGRGEKVHVAAGIALTLGPLLIIQYYLLALLQGQLRIRAFNICRLLGPAVFTALLLLSFEVLSLLQVVVFSLAAQLMVVLVGAFLLKRQDVGNTSWSQPDVRSVQREGVRGYLAQVSPMESFKLDQLAVGFLFSASSSGVYAVALSLSNAPRFVADGVAAVAYPRAARADPETQRAVLRRYTLLSLYLCALVGCPLAVASHWLIPVLFGQEYRSSAPLAVILIGGSVLLSVRRVVLDCLRAFGRPGLATLLELTLLTCFAVALVPARSGGLDGVGIALLTVIAISSAATIWTAGKETAVDPNAEEIPLA